MADQNGFRRTRGRRPGADRRQGVVRADVSQVGGARGEGVLVADRRFASGRQNTVNRKAGAEHGGPERAKAAPNLTGSGQEELGSGRRAARTVGGTSVDDGVSEEAMDAVAFEEDANGERGGRGARRGPDGGGSEGWWRSELTGGGSCGATAGAGNWR